jgi:hypothetical protein
LHFGANWLLKAKKKFTDPTELFPSIVLVIAGEKRFLTIKLQFKDRENLTWRWILDAVECCFALLRRVCWPALEECSWRTRVSTLDETKGPFTPLPSGQEDLGQALLKRTR